MHITYCVCVTGSVSIVTLATRFRNITQIFPKIPNKLDNRILVFIVSFRFYCHVTIETSLPVIKFLGLELPQCLQCCCCCFVFSFICCHHHVHSGLTFYLFKKSSS